MSNVSSISEISCSSWREIVTLKNFPTRYSVEQMLTKKKKVWQPFQNICFSEHTQIENDDRGEHDRISAAAEGRKAIPSSSTIDNLPHGCLYNKHNKKT